MGFLDSAGLVRFKQKLDALFNTKLSTSLKGSANGLAELNDQGKVPATQLPSYVDDVVEYNSFQDLPAVGEAGKIYVTTDTSQTYRWSGSTFTIVGNSITLGETSSTAYRGDRGKAAYDHASENGKVTTPVTAGLYKVSVTGEGHIGSTDAVTKADIELLGIPGTDTWRGIQDNLTSNGNTTDSLSANQGYLLANGLARDNSKRSDEAPEELNWFKGTPKVSSDGGMEVGKYIDFHDTDDSNLDYSARITGSNTGFTLTGTTKGTFEGDLTGDVTGDLTGNADTATQLETPRTINGTNFDGTSNITTNKWGTIRTITIKDADSTNAGTAIDVDGSGNVILPLPSTIKASLTGTATTATFLAPTAAAGYTTDDSGNFTHKRSTTSDYWHLNKNSGSAVLSVYWENGNVSATGTVTAAGFSGPLTGNVTGNVAGNVTGNLTGNVTGNVSGSSGSCTGNAATATALKDKSNNTITYSNYGAAGISSDSVTWLTCWNGYELRTIKKDQILMRYAWWSSGTTHNANDLHGGITFAYSSHSNTATTGTLVDFSCGGNDGYPLQLQGNYSGNALFFRNRNGDNNTWGGWQRVVTNSGSWSISVTGSSASCTGNAATATNADKVDNYHAADLWRKDGGTWNGNANISCTPTANNQEYSFDLGNAYTGTYWHVWSGKNSKSILVCYNDNMNVSVPNGTLTAKAFSGPLTGNVTGNCSGSAGSVAWENTGHPSTFPPSSHNHGTLHNDFTVSLASTTTDSGWSMINSSYSGFLLKSIRFNANSPAWGVGNYGAGICFGGSDTKGIISCAYGSPSIKIAGGNGTKPVWYIGLTGTTAKTYDLNAPVTNITRSGTTFTATRANGTTFTFTQQDNDTNTWRGIQNNLTSTSTTDSLSAAQGKALYDKMHNCTLLLTWTNKAQTTVANWGAYKFITVVADGYNNRLIRTFPTAALTTGKTLWLWEQIESSNYCFGLTLVSMSGNTATIKSASWGASVQTVLIYGSVAT